MRRLTAVFGLAFFALLASCTNETTPQPEQGVGSQTPTIPSYLSVERTSLGNIVQIERQPSKTIISTSEERVVVIRGWLSEEVEIDDWIDLLDIIDARSEHFRLLCTHAESACSHILEIKNIPQKEKVRPEEIPE